MKVQENKDKKMSSKNNTNKQSKDNTPVKGKKKIESSDSEPDICSSDEDDFDVHEFRKTLQKMFPSKHLDNKVKAGNDVKKAFKKMKNTKKETEEDDDEDEDEEQQQDEEVEKSKKSKKKSDKKSDKKASVKSKKKKIVESDSDDDEDDGDDPKNVGKFNIIFTVGGGEDEDYDDDDEWYEDDEDEDDDWETEDEDEDVSSSDEDDEDDEEDIEEDEEEDDEEEEEEEEQEEFVVTRSKSKAMKRNKSNKDLKDLDEEDKEGDKDVYDNNTFMKELKSLYAKNKDNEKAKACVKACEESIKEHNKKQKRKEEKHKEKNTRIFRKLVRDKNTNNDFEFFGKLEVDNQKKIIKELRDINKIIRVEKPYRLTLLEADMPPIFKGAAMKKINSLRYMEPGSGEYYKIKNWVDTFMRIPFGKYEQLPLTIDNGVEECHGFMENAKNTLDKAVYGLDDAKMQIMQMMGQLITNPSSVGTAIAIQGPMGTGKTTLVKEGISKILNRPFAFIALGGATDSSFLEGHSYTYEGSTWGKIVQILVDSKCMNPVIYFDELDKISDTPKGEEIAGILTHLTDTSQNTQFHDKYFAEIDFDLSKCLFIFSYNDESKINPILRDRMYRIHTKGYEKKQKTVIANDYLLPKIREQVKFTQDDIIIPEETLHYIMTEYCDNEQGVRNMKRCLEIIHTKLNLYRLMKPDTNLFQDEMSLKVTFPFTVSVEVVRKLIKQDKPFNMSLAAMYL